MRFISNRKYLPWGNCFGGSSERLCWQPNINPHTEIFYHEKFLQLRFPIRAREIVGFAGSGPIFETENRFISRPEAEKSVHKTLYFSRFYNKQTDIVTCQNRSHLIIRCYLS